ncbi:HNH endonuclease [Kitasatospora sp. NPDC003701]
MYAAYRQRRRTAPTLTDRQLFAAWEEADAWRCIYCDRPWSEREHVVPLARGGRDVLGNVWPACAECNASKGDADLWEWLAPRFANPSREGLGLSARGVSQSLT